MMRNKEEIRLQRVVASLCATLFAVFSFFFIAKYQSSLLELLYDRFATGKLKFNAYVAATVVTAALTLLAVWLNKFSKYRREWTALSFLPSILILSFITDIDRSIYTGGYNYLKWVIIFAVASVAYAFFSFVMRRILFAKIKNVAMNAYRILWRNLVLFVFMFALAGILSNSEEGFKREATLYTCLKKGDKDSALRVGYLSNVSSKTLSAQRAYMLASYGMLGEKLFEYPQYYGIDGLLPSARRVSPLVPDSVYSLIGTTPLPGEDAMTYLHRAATTENSASAAKEYYLSALLLNGELPAFVNYVGIVYPDVPLNELPKHYQEAIYLYYNINGVNVAGFDGTAVQREYNKLKELELLYSDPFERSNYIRRKFGRTYWRYILYGNI